MIPPRGLKNEIYPLQHKFFYSFGLSIITSTMNSAMCSLVRHNKTPTNQPAEIAVNPHNTFYVEETGPAVQKMSIIDKMKLSINFNLTENATNRAIDAIDHIYLLWRPIFFSFPEKLDATDDDTSTDVKTILQLTKDATNLDVVPITSNNLPVLGSSELSQPVSTINLAEDFNTYNMTIDTLMEDVAWDENLFVDASRRYTNKGALQACVGRTRHVHLTKGRPTAKFFFDKFVPRSIRRVQPYSFMAILVHVPLISDIQQDYHATDPTASVAHVGVKIKCLYHEWNADHHQAMSGAGILPT